ncbi:hypothetical protein JOM56_014586 [Amanita muscaria]
MALEMLSACSHRWQTVDFDLSDDWQVSSILQYQGQLPTLESLVIRVDAINQYPWCMFEAVPRLTHASIGLWANNYGWILPWTQLTELKLTLDGLFVIENGYVADLLPMLPNIKELRFRLNDGLDLYFADYQQDYDEPLDVHEQISSLIQRSNCIIRKLSIESGRRFYVGTLKDDYLRSDEIRSPIDISSLQQLRLLTIICRIDDVNELFNSKVSKSAN